MDVGIATLVGALIGASASIVVARISSASFAAALQTAINQAQNPPFNPSIEFGIRSRSRLSPAAIKTYRAVGWVLVCTLYFLALFFEWIGISAIRIDKNYVVWAGATTLGVIVFGIATWAFRRMKRTARK
jgi:hypothetical protein